MSNKKHSSVTTEVFIHDHSQPSEHAHLLEHVHFLEERTNELETKVEILREVFTTLLELDEGEDEEDDDEDECDKEEDLFSHKCHCLWDEDDAC